MKFTVLQENLSKGLSTVSRVVSPKSTLPILANVLVEVSGGSIKLIATDLSIGVNTIVSADVESEGKITVSAKTFAEFVNSLPKGKLEIELNSNQLHIKSDQNSASFNTIPADDYPSLASPEGKPDFKLNALEFKEAIDQVVFTAAMDDARPALTGIQFEIDEGGLLMVAVDGFRLSKKFIEVKVPEEFTPLVPARSLQELSKIIGDSETGLETEVEIYHQKDKSQLIFVYKDYELVTRLVDAKFPDYKQIIPSEHKTRVIFNVSELASTVKIINIFARSVIGNKCILDIDTSAGKVSVQASLTEVGENQSEVEVAAEGDVLVVAFSAKYLNDMLSNINSDTIVFESNGPTMPGVFRPSDEKGKTDDSYLHIIMPMRLE